MIWAKEQDGGIGRLHGEAVCRTALPRLPRDDLLKFLEWVKHLQSWPSKIFIVTGDDSEVVAAMDTLKP